MLLIVIRHGESEADLLGIHEGRADYGLTERGFCQASAMATYITEKYTITKLYSSPLKRADQTAEQLSEKAHIPIIYDERLMEFNNGLLAGMPKTEAAEKYPIVQDLPVDQAVYGQESKLEFRRRADSVLTSIIKESSDEDVIAIVSHGGMINQLYHSALNMPEDSKNTFITSDTGVHIWEKHGDKIRIITANMNAHAMGI